MNYIYFDITIIYAQLTHISSGELRKEYYQLLIDFCTREMKYQSFRNILMGDL